MKIKTAAVLCSIWACASAHAQSGVIYSQNFEVPNAGTSCIKFGNVAAGLTSTSVNDAGTFAQDYNGTGQVGSASYQQVGTADRLCWDMATAPQATRITDPSGLGGQFSGGFGRNNSGNIEAWGGL